MSDFNLNDSDDEYADFDFDLDPTPFTDGLYLLEVDSMKVVHFEKSDSNNHVVNMHVVSECPYKGVQVSLIAPMKGDNIPFNRLEMGKKQLRSFLTAALYSTDLTPDLKALYEKDDEGNWHAPALEGLEVGAWLKQNGEYINIDFKGFVAANEVEDDSAFE